MCCTHHVQTYLEEKGRNVTVHSDTHLTGSAPPSAPKTTARTNPCAASCAQRPSRATLTSQKIRNAYKRLCE